MVAITNKPTARALLASGVPLPVVQLDWGNINSKAQLITVTSPASQSGVFNGGQDVIVEICSSTDCWYTVTGNSGLSAQVATVNNQFLSGGSSRYVYIPSGNMIGVIQNSSSGAMSAIPILLAT